MLLLCSENALLPVFRSLTSSVAKIIPVSAFLSYFHLSIDSYSDGTWLLWYHGSSFTVVLPFQYMRGLQARLFSSGFVLAGLKGWCKLMDKICTTLRVRMHGFKG